MGWKSGLEPPTSWTTIRRISNFIQYNTLRAFLWFIVPFSIPLTATLFTLSFQLLSNWGVNNPIIDLITFKAYHRNSCTPHKSSWLAWSYKGVITRVTFVCYLRSHQAYILICRSSKLFLILSGSPNLSMASLTPP